MPKYHETASGDVAVCRAKLRPCPLRKEGSFHGNSEQEVLDHIAQSRSAVPAPKVKPSEADEYDLRERQELAAGLKYVIDRYSVSRGKRQVVPAGTPIRVVNRAFGTTVDGVLAYEVPVGLLTDSVQIIDAEGRRVNAVGKLTKSHLDPNREVASLLANSPADNTAGINSKHFDHSRGGSQFTDPRVKNTSDVLRLAYSQRGSIDGDDREELIKHGGDPATFKDGVRYLMVSASGNEGMIHSSKLDDDEVVTVMAKHHEGSEPSLSFTVETERKPKTPFGTIIIGPDPKEPEKEVLWTMFPGLPGAAPRSATLREKGLDDGSQMTVKELRETFGDFKVNTIVKQG